MSRCLWVDAGLPERCQTWRLPWLSHPCHDRRPRGKIIRYFYGRFRRSQPRWRGRRLYRQWQQDRHVGDVLLLGPGTIRQIFWCVGVSARWTPGGSHSLWRKAGVAGFAPVFRRLQTRVAKLLRRSLAPPHISVDAQWRSSKPQFFSTAALAQVFTVQKNGFKFARITITAPAGGWSGYVHPHSLLNYTRNGASSIPESSLARLNAVIDTSPRPWPARPVSQTVFRGEVRSRNVWKTALSRIPGCHANLCAPRLTESVVFKTIP